MHSSFLSDRVYAGLRARIAGGEFNENLRLLGELELARTFDISRPVVRDALRRLRAEGLIYSRRGIGSFLRQPHTMVADRVGFAPVATFADIQRCYELRINLEPAGARLAAARRSEGDVIEIERALHALGQVDKQHRKPADEAFAFHLAVSEASKNHYFMETIQALKTTSA